MRNRLHAHVRRLDSLRLLGLAVLAQILAWPATAAGQATPDKAFVRDYCASCHNSEDKRGQLDLTALAFNAKDPANQAVWIKVHDRVRAGEMPPKSRARPDAARQKIFVEGLAK